MSPIAPQPAPLTAAEVQALEEIAERVLWLAVRIVDAANHDRPNNDGIKVGGHQASSASMVTLMTALWFAHLDASDLVSVKPHASPVLHAIHYLLGGLEERHLRELRSAGGLQAYPSRSKDHDRVDFSTGSVGLGATAPLFAAAARRYVDAHFGERPSSRFVSLLGDAELDEGNIWEALLDPSLAGLGNVLWVVDLNRQSLDRVVPGIKVTGLQRAFADAGWQVLEAKYGRRLEEVFARPGGEALRQRIDAMPNDEYQALFGLAGSAARKALCQADPALVDLLADVPDEDIPALVTNLGGHDVAALLETFRAADRTPHQPTVVFAYTIKGWGLEIAGDPLNHSALLTTEQTDRQRTASGLTVSDEWSRMPPDSPAGRLVAAAALRWGNLAARRSWPRTRAAPAGVPASVLSPPKAGQVLSTQEAFGRALTALAREACSDRIVTVAPDVAVSTNLGGWINKVGVFAPAELTDWLGEARTLRWKQSPAGRHIELGISEMNLFSALGQLGLTWDLSGELLLPIGTVYDPFVCRGLDAFIYAAYNGARFVIAGTPSGVTLGPEGGAHQSTVTASLGVELPGVTMAEPAYATALDWLLCDGLRELSDLDRPARSLYLRLSTRPLPQEPFAAALDRIGADDLRTAVLAGGYLLREVPAEGGPRVQLISSGAVTPEVLLASETLQDEGIEAPVVDVTSLDRLYRGWVGARRAPVRDLAVRAQRPHVAGLLEPGVPIVTVHDAASHAMAWLGAVHGSRTLPLGVDDFGQSGSIPEIYRAFELDTDAVVNAALVALG